MSAATSLIIYRSTVSYLVKISSFKLVAAYLVVHGSRIRGRADFNGYAYLGTPVRQAGSRGMGVLVSIGASINIEG